MGGFNMLATSFAIILSMWACCVHTFSEGAGNICLISLISHGTLKTSADGLNFFTTCRLIDDTSLELEFISSNYVLKPGLCKELRDFTDLAQWNGCIITDCIDDAIVPAVEFLCYDYDNIETATQEIHHIEQDDFIEEPFYHHRATFPIV